MKQLLKSHHYIPVTLAVLYGIGFGLLLTLSPITGYAETTSISINRAIIESAGSSNESTTESFTVTNNQNAYLPIRLSSQPLMPRDIDSEPLLSASPWIKFEEPNFILGPKETKIINFTISVPEKAPAGGHYADLILQVLQLEEQTSIATPLPEIRVRFFMTVRGDINNSATVTLQHPRWLITDKQDDIAFSYRITNTGNIHRIFNPSIRITKGDRVEILTANPIVLLPQESYTFIFQPDSAIPRGLHQVSLQLFEDEDKEISQLVVLPFHPFILMVATFSPLSILIVIHRARIKQAVSVILHGQ
jgi:hypothetical protein